MLPNGSTDSIILGILFAAGILVVFLVLAAIANIAFALVLRRRRKREGDTPQNLGIRILSSLQGPVVLFLILFGVFLSFISLTQITHSNFATIRGLDAWARKIWLIAIVFQASYLASHITQALLRWYIQKASKDSRTILDTKLGPTIDRLLPIVVISIASIIALDTLGLAISPLLAGLGIGGLAVALALTPTISSFIAGTYVVTEGQIKEGDFIEIDDRTSGWVLDVGWRSTVLRSFHNNVIIVPNSKITDSVVTNFTTPTPIVSVILENGVSYDSDLREVHRISVEVANKVIQESEYSNRNFEAVVLFREFADSNITFRIVTQATDRFGGFRMQSELIMQIHERFKEEGIEINYPMRKLVLPMSGDGFFPIRQTQASEIRRDNGTESQGAETETVE